MRALVVAATALGLLGAGAAGAYPLDGYPETDIHRLEAYYLAKDALLASGALVPGSTRGMDEVKLGLVDRPGFTLPEPDAEFTAKIEEFLGADAPGYGIAVLDISDPANPVYAEVSAGRPQNPGSVGKILVALGWFQALADQYPDVADRQRLLKEAQVTADVFIRKDSHLVPIWRPGDPKVQKRPIQEGDTANLYTFFDWMMSASSNAAASMMMSELMSFRHFGAEYPVTTERKLAFFDETPKVELGNQLRAALQDPLAKSDIDKGKLRQGKFFTREGKRRVDGPSSVATPRELLRYAMLMEQGKLVDPWSSLEIKRLLYLTDRRIRYASHPALDESAVCYKSGSLYGCQPEPGFECGKYMGNRVNYLNSLAVVESDEDGRHLHYIVSLMSNVLRKNSSVEHQTLAMRIHRLIESMHPPAPAGDAVPSPVPPDAPAPDATRGSTSGS